MGFKDVTARLDFTHTQLQVGSCQQREINIKSWETGITNGIRKKGTEARPINMRAIWIMEAG